MKTYTENMKETKSYKEFRNGYFGEYGGRFVPDVLADKLEHLSEVFHKFKSDPEFDAEYRYYLNTMSAGLLLYILPATFQIIRGARYT